MYKAEAAESRVNMVWRMPVRLIQERAVIGARLLLRADMQLINLRHSFLIAITNIFGGYLFFRMINLLGVNGVSQLLPVMSILNAL
ncbi:MAG: hypothetical protein ACJAUP_001281 [Cellvibrionaceae bacterium]|jgi:hypothetical protein